MEMGASNNNPKSGTLSNDVRSIARESEIMVYSVQTSSKDLKPKDDLSIINLDDSSSSRGSSISSGTSSFDYDSQNNVEAVELGQLNASPPTPLQRLYSNRDLLDLVEKWAQAGFVVPTEEEICQLLEGTLSTDGENKSLEDKLSPISFDSGLNTSSTCCESQPLIQKPVKTSFWKSCCGIFELITSSDR